MQILVGPSRQSDIHIIPAWEDDDHVASEDCVCEPRIECEDHHTRRRVYVHVSREEAL